jgi:alkylation response protein AidB-like acyl-CoA dehydrogenase
MSQAAAITGAGFLLAEVDPSSMMTPERLTDDQRMMRETARRFTQDEVVPRLPELEKLDPQLSKKLLQRAGELGLCLIDIPEEYGGLGLDFVSSIQVPEVLSRGGGFCTTFEVQTVIGLLPILYFGSEELKTKYLARIGSTEITSAYALTEPGSGSDALAAKTTARLEGDHWTLNGSKQFITNGGFADLFIVFAQVEGDKFSAFAVERDSPGFTVGAEEHKMGIKSSSTTTLAFADCRIPKSHLIGEIGQGAAIALNTLNVGRLKLGIGGVGSAKEAFECSAKYALERRQFGRPIAEFGAIREKIAEMATRIYAAESTMLRTTGAVQDAIEHGKSSGDGGGKAASNAMMAALKEFNVECAIEKVHGSETQDFCVDEGVQIHGGYGFIEEYTVARLYRDARISRLYEGTNEINRMQIAGDVLKRAGKGALALPGKPEQVGNGSVADFGALAGVADQLRRAKTIVGRLAGAILKGRGGMVDKRGPNQELLPRLADIIIAIYATESAMARAAQARASGYEHAELFETMTRVYAEGAGHTIRRAAREAVMQLTGATDEECALFEALGSTDPQNVIALRRTIADAMFSRQGEWFI